MVLIEGSQIHQPGPASLQLSQTRVFLQCQLEKAAGRNMLLGHQPHLAPWFQQQRPLT